MARKTAATAQAPARRTLYGVHPGVAMVQGWIAGLKAKTGRTLDEWLEFIRSDGPPTEKERRDWLKATHKLGTNVAGWLAERVEGKGTWDDDPEAYLRAAEQYVESMFSGKRAALRPAYDELLRLGLATAADVKACPARRSSPSTATTSSRRSSRPPTPGSTWASPWGTCRSRAD